MPKVEIRLDSLQAAILVMRVELMKQGDLYDSFVVSIGSALRESGVPDSDVGDIAIRVLNRIIGLEE